MPALALTDLANVFGMVKFYGAARAAGVKPIIGGDCWMQNEADRDKPFRAAAAVPVPRRLPAPVRAAVARLAEEPVPRPRRDLRRAGSSEGGHRGPDRALRRAPAATSGRRCSAATPRRPSASARRGPTLLPGPLLPRAAARRRCPTARRWSRARVALATRLKLPVVATHPVQFLAPRRLQGARGARLHRRRATCSADQRRPRASRRSSTSRRQAEMAELFADLPQALANTVEIARRCNLAIELGKSRLPDFPTPDGHDRSRSILRDARREAGLRAALRASCIPTQARGQAPRYRERLEFEIKTIVQMGFAGYFLIVADFINWAKANGVPVGPGPRLGRGLAGRLLARHHRPRSAALRPAVRALPQSRARVDAGLRHRLLPGRARPRDRVRAQEVRRADACRRSPPSAPWRRRAVVRDVGRVLDLRLQLLRPDRQADPVPARQADHARRTRARWSRS